MKNIFRSLAILLSAIVSLSLVSCGPDGAGMSIIDSPGGADL